MDTVQQYFFVPEDNFAQLEERIDKLTRRAEKLGLTPPSLHVEAVQDFPLIWRDNMTDMIDFGCDRGNTKECRTTLPADARLMGYRRYLVVKLEGEAPTVPGWSLVAVVEHASDNDIGNVVRVVPGKTYPSFYRSGSPVCNHCNTVRRRLETFILQGPDGDFKQIGRNCLADYCRDAEAAEKMVALAEILESVHSHCCALEDDGGEHYGSGIPARVGTESVLAMTARIIRHCGWLSRSLARTRADEGRPGVATADIIREIFFSRDFWKETAGESREKAELRAAARDVQESDKKLGLDALAWVREMRPRAESLSDYEHNLLVVLSDETLKERHLGIACSAIASYQRYISREEEKKIQAQVRTASVHFGTPKERSRWPMKVIGINHWENDWGVTHLYRFVTGEGNIAIWKSSVEVSVDVGDEVMVLGTIKEHGEYKETKQTILNRCDVYRVGDCGHCPNCNNLVLRNDLGKNCPACKKRGLKVAEGWFPAHTTVGQESVGVSSDVANEEVPF
jgi:hypothetical protein